ncbi:MAG: response regulator [Polyangiaceae bacterium]
MADRRVEGARKRANARSRPHRGTKKSRAGRANVALLTDIIAYTPKPIVVLDGHLTIQIVNVRASELFGYSEGELVGQSIDILSGEGSSRLRSSSQSGDAQANRLTFVARRKDGTEFPLDAVIRPIADRDVVVLVGREPDTAESKRLQEALVQVRKETITAMQRRTDFLARMSHEIRTPMNGVLGILELVLDTPLSSEHQEQLTLALKLARGLLTLLDDILDFSKIDAGKLRLDLVNFSLRDEIGTAVQALAPAAHEKGLELVIHIPPEVPDLVVGDPKRIAQIVSNLVSNAVKFTEFGSILVGVAVEDQEKEGSTTVTISVTDSGVGIAPENLASIFDPFTQADEPTNPRRGGVGLGLAICCELAQLMGARLSAQSQMGRGSQFNLTITLDTPPTPRGAKADRLRGLRVLAVVDHPTTRDVLLAVMNASALTATMAHSSEAVALVATQGPFDVLIVDVDLAKADCTALVDSLRRNGAIAPLVLLVPARRIDSSAKLDGMRPNATLPKPILARSFLSVIEAVAHGESPKEPHSVVEEAPGSTGLSVLVAEDDPANRYVQRTLLQRAGHAVTVVENGKRAVAAAEEQRFDVILMDVQMPEMDGLTATRQIRAREAGTGERVPIVALTAQAIDGDRSDCLAAGMDAYLAKPIDAERLLATLERFAAMARSRARAGDDGQRRVTPRPFFVGQPGLGSKAIQSTYDRVALIRRLGNDEALVRDVETLFVCSLDELLQRVTDAVARADAGATRSTSHALASALSSVSARRSLEIARMMEEAARAGDSVTPRTLLDPLLHSTAELAAHVRRSLDERRDE